MGSRELEIDPDVARARTPPAWLYRDASVLEALRERAFAPSWQWLDAPAPPPGAAQPATLLPGLLDEPLVLTADEHGTVRCLSNACTHRGHLVCRAPERASALRCRYHGRRFALDGRFLSMPAFDDVEGFPTPDDDLAALPLERLGPLAFTAVRAPALPFAAWIAPLVARLEWLPWDELVLDPRLSRDYDVAASWALYCDNYLEGFHIPFVHPGLNEVLEPRDYRTELFGHGNLQIGVAKEGETAFAPPPGSPDEGQRIGGYYLWLFPNLMLNVYPWGLSLNAVQPQGVDRTRVAFRSYVWRRELLGRGAGDGLHQVELEDEAVVEGVHAGLASSRYGRGRYSPTRERGVHQFHRLLQAALGG